MKKILFFVLSVVAASNSMQAQVLNQDFENWKTINLLFPLSQHQVPSSWYGIDSLVHTASVLLQFTPQKTMFKETTSVYSGQAAVKLVTRTQGTIGTLPGALSNAAINIDPSNPQNFTYSGGSVISQKIKSVQARVKYAPRGTDKASIMATAVLTGQGANGQDSVIGTGDTLLSQTLSSYTRVGVDIDYGTSTATPDKIIIVFLSSGLQGGGMPVDSSMLWVDSVTLSLFPVDVKETKGKINTVKCSPNPANDKLYIESSLNTDVTIRIYTADGRLAASKDFAGKVELDIAHLAAGTYYYQVTGNKNEMIQQDKLVIAR